MALSDLLFPIFVIPSELQMLCIESWLIGGPHGLALCKVVEFKQYVSITVSIQILVLIAVDRFGAVVYPLRSPLISTKLCPFLVLVTSIVGIPIHSQYLFALNLAECLERWICVLYLNEVFGGLSSFANYFAPIKVVFDSISFGVIAILYIIIYLKLKSQKSPGEHSVNTGQQRRQRE